MGGKDGRGGLRGGGRWGRPSTLLCHLKLLGKETPVASPGAQKSKTSQQVCRLGITFFTCCRETGSNNLCQISQLKIYVLWKLLPFQSADAGAYRNLRDGIQRRWVFLCSYGLLRGREAAAQQGAGAQGTPESGNETGSKKTEQKHQRLNRRQQK